MSKKTRCLNGDGTKVYANEHDNTGLATGRKLRRLAKHKLHLFEEQNNVGNCVTDEHGNVVKLEKCKTRGRFFRKYFKRKKREVIEIDPIWSEWVQETIHIIARDSLLSLRNLAIVAAILTIIFQLT